jgi:DUF2075 family protein
MRMVRKTTKKRKATKPKTKYYVTMTDRFMSGWGQAKGKINKYVVECDTYEQAERIERNAKRRDEMKYINIIVGRCPSYDKRRYVVSLKKYKDLGDVWKR